MRGGKYIFLIHIILVECFIKLTYNILQFLQLGVVAAAEKINYSSEYNYYCYYCKFIICILFKLHVNVFTPYYH